MSSKSSKSAKSKNAKPRHIGQIRRNKINQKLKKSIVVSREREEKVKDVGILLPSEPGYLEAEGMERVYAFSQDDIRENIDIRSQKKIYELNLPFGPYHIDYTRNGRNLLLGGSGGHLALVLVTNLRLKTEFHVKEKIRAVKFLHDEMMFAVAQKKHVFIYDHSGIELHCLRDCTEINRLEFLPYHFLLVSVGRFGKLQYRDTSNGGVVATHPTKMGECSVMKQNPYNAIICLGHNNGRVTMWSPNVHQPLVIMQCHQGPLLDLAVDQEGKYIATSAVDGKVQVWDIRTYKRLHTYYSASPASTIDISQNGLLALGFGCHIQIWKDALVQKQASPYMNQILPSNIIEEVHFRPFEDVLGIGHLKGFKSMIVPGAGEANFDSFEANPFQTKKQRSEYTVHSLLDKLSPDMITLDPHSLTNTVVESTIHRSRDKLGTTFDKETKKQKKVRRKKIRSEKARIMERKTSLTETLEDEPARVLLSKPTPPKTKTSGNMPTSLKRFRPGPMFLSNKRRKL